MSHLFNQLQPNQLQLSQPLNNQQVGKAWEWLVWALQQPPSKRVPPQEFKELDQQDWVLLLQELNETYEEQKHHLLQ
jgi:hypothetical protein